MPTKNLARIVLLSILGMRLSLAWVITSPHPTRVKHAPVASPSDRRMRIASVSKKLKSEEGVNTFSREVENVGLSSSLITPGGRDDGGTFVLYRQRWMQLAILALLALLSDMVCFSVASAPGTWTDTFHQNPNDLVDIYLLTNVRGHRHGLSH
jgi:hypothetical protein